MRIRFLGQHVQGSLAVLALAEFVLLSCSLFIAALLRFEGSFATIDQEVGPLGPRMLLFGAVMVISLLALGLYSSRQRALLIGIAARVAAAIGIGTAVTAICFYIVPNIWIGRGVLSIAAVLSFGAMTLSCSIFAQVADEVAFKRRVLVYGCGRRAASIANLRRRSDRRGFVVVGYAQPDGETRTVPEELIIGVRDKLLEVCHRLNVDELVVAMDDRRRAFPIVELLECRMDGVDVTELLTFLERETGRVRLDVFNPSWMIFGSGFRRDSLRVFSSRALDVVASLAILFVSLPVIALTGLAIKLEDGWRAPVFYRQVRVGLGNEPFGVLKFRSMRTDAERDGKARWAQESDPRVTRVGAIIRKLRIDELPQILNVLRGHMSFIGPRPERPEFVAELARKIPYYLQRHSVKPGITGWAQLCYPYGSSARDALEKLQYDLYYIKNNSLLFDLAILVQTAEVVFMGQGAR